MEELIQILEMMGIPRDECARIRNYFDDDIDGLTYYVLYMRAAFDDRHEYMD